MLRLFLFLRVSDDFLNFMPNMVKKSVFFKFFPFLGVSKVIFIFFLLFVAFPEKSSQKTRVFCDFLEKFEFWSEMNITITFLVKIPF